MKPHQDQVHWRCLIVPPRCICTNELPRNYLKSPKSELLSSLCSPALFAQQATASLLTPAPRYCRCHLRPPTARRPRCRAAALLSASQLLACLPRRRKRRRLELGPYVHHFQAHWTRYQMDPNSARVGYLGFFSVKLPGKLIGLYGKGWNLLRRAGEGNY